MKRYDKIEGQDIGLEPYPLVGYATREDALETIN
jgi:hypothetical protein